MFAVRLDDIPPGSRQDVPPVIPTTYETREDAQARADKVPSAYHAHVIALSDAQVHALFRVTNGAAGWQ